MKFFFFSLGMLGFLSGIVTAELPKKAPINRYANLWLNSPFTSKPVLVAAGEQASIFSEYALAGVSPIKGGYRVTLMNKKNPSERIFIDSDDTSSKYKVISVDRKDGDFMETSVRLSSGSQVGTVRYDKKLLSITAPKTAPPSLPGMPPTAPPTKPGQQPLLQPRPRIIPPNPGPTHSSQRNAPRSGGRRN
jgi:hypothetical protein